MPHYAFRELLILRKSAHHDAKGRPINPMEVKVRVYRELPGTSRMRNPGEGLFVSDVKLFLSNAGKIIKRGTRPPDDT